ncbi:MAG: adenylate/guanylate cyclase domain-containing protein [Chloroflexi bacterium]|jgi:adenylate cyclase|nr:adenylate/guanylate cyclase domain-containing protein [Chloroflexota bacterium]
MFADVRGSTALAERIGPTEFAGLMNRFYKAASDVLVPRTAILDKMIGDEVMAFYLPAFVDDSRSLAVEAAVALLKKLGQGDSKGPWLEVGVGLNYGSAYVGKVGNADVGDFTALGDAVNTAARLQSEAAAGKIVMSDSVYESVSDKYPGLESIEVDAKGKTDLVGAHVLDLN